MVGAISLDPVSIKNLAKKTGNTPLYFRDAWYWSKFKAFIYGVEDIQDNLGEGVSISAKLFGSDKDKKRNGTRLLAELEKIDTSEKMKYILNATKSLLIGLIDSSLYFRLIDVIADTLPEDLEYFSSIAITTCTYSGSLQINTLQRKGLLMQAGVDANVDIEKQENIVTN